MKYILANWKANKNFPEVREWIYTFVREYRAHENVTIVIFPPFPFISYVQGKLKDCKNVFVGSQTLSTFGEGSYTGEVTAASLEGMAAYTIIGHSERRKTFSETDEQLAEKVKHALVHTITPVYCVRDENDPIPPNVKFVAYEPITAIGTGKAEPVDQTITMKKKIKLAPGSFFIYGGSVQKENIADYLAAGEIDGFLIGKASLDASHLIQIANTAKSYS